MRRKSLSNLLLLATSLLLLLGTAACGGGKAVDLDINQVMADMTSQYPIEGGITLGESDLPNFYGIDAAWVESFAAQMSADGITANELVLVKATDEDSAKEVEGKLKSRLEARRNEFRDYLPDQYAIVEKSEVQRNGVYVCMIISPQQDKLTELYQSYLKG